MSEPSPTDADRDGAEVPSGLPAEEAEAPPLGVPDEADDTPERGAEAMPGIPTDGEPPDAG
jgi:hypothetical protein